jgi:hypothetical protein
MRYQAVAPFFLLAGIFIASHGVTVSTWSDKILKNALDTLPLIPQDDLHIVDNQVS